jgi:murein DD-endopeptidase MepM/ murein hydrolase activator NlpD
MAGLLETGIHAGAPAQDGAAGAARALEALVLKQMLTASGAFKGAAAGGNALYSDLFVDTLGEAIAKAGGLGLAAQIEQSLEPAGSKPPTPGPFSPPSPSASLPPLVAAQSHITSPFGQRRDPFDGHAAHHSGVDVAAPEGSPVLAAADGIVRQAGDRGGYGAALEIDHGNGVTTLYAHTSELLVREGDRVQKGQAIAKVGHTGRATGDHLHFEVRRGNQPVDPARALRSYVLPEPQR